MNNNNNSRSSSTRQTTPNQLERSLLKQQQQQQQQNQTNNKRIHLTIGNSSCIPELTSILLSSSSSAAALTTTSSTTTTTINTTTTAAASTQQQQQQNQNHHHELNISIACDSEDAQFFDWTENNIEMKQLFATLGSIQQHDVLLPPTPNQQQCEEVEEEEGNNIATTANNTTTTTTATTVDVAASRDGSSSSSSSSSTCSTTCSEDVQHQANNTTTHTMMTTTTMKKSLQLTNFGGMMTYDGDDGSTSNDTTGNNPGRIPITWLTAALTGTSSSNTDGGASCCDCGWTHFEFMGIHVTAQNEQQVLDFCHALKAQTMLEHVEWCFGRFTSLNNNNDNNNGSSSSSSGSGERSSSSNSSSNNNNNHTMFSHIVRALAQLNNNNPSLSSSSSSTAMTGRRGSCLKVVELSGEYNGAIGQLDHDCLGQLVAGTCTASLEKLTLNYFTLNEQHVLSMMSTLATTTTSPVLSTELAAAATTTTKITTASTPTSATSPVVVPTTPTSILAQLPVQLQQQQQQHPILQDLRLCLTRTGVVALTKILKTNNCIKKCIIWPPADQYDWNGHHDHQQQQQRHRQGNYTVEEQRQHDEEDCLVTMANALRHNKTLQDFRVWGVRVKLCSSQEHAFAMMLQETNTTLTTLKLGTYAGRCRHVIDFYLRLNKMKCQLVVIGRSGECIVRQQPQRQWVLQGCPIIVHDTERHTCNGNQEAHGGSAKGTMTTATTTTIITTSNTHNQQRRNNSNSKKQYDFMNVLADHRRDFPALAYYIRVNPTLWLPRQQLSSCRYRRQSKSTISS